jgi:predicted ATPase/DNA-binding XRE family transcriptional regulator
MAQGTAEHGGGDRVSFGRLLRDFRVGVGLTQDELAELARMSAGGISVLERGIRTAPRRETIALLASALGLSEADRRRLEESAARPPRARRRNSVVESEGAFDRHNLPLALNSFLGREQECDQLLKQLSERRLITICGVGGVGKTRLALETARNLVESFRDGVWLSELAALDGSSPVDASIAALLGVSQQMAPASADAWIGALVGKNLLVILDNCEHVLVAAAAVAKSLLERCPRVRILATSREPLRIAGEVVVRLRPLAHAHAGAAPAIRLFLDRASDVAPEFAQIDHQDPRMITIERLCRRLDGLPLAIELAAAHAGAASPEMLMRALDRHNELPSAGGSSAPPRHQTLRSLLDWSYGLLEETEQRVLRQLAVFAGGCTLDAAEALCDGIVERARVLPTLLSLVEKSLVIADTRVEDTRYDLLGTTRAYVREHLVAHGEHARAARAQAEYYCALAKDADETYGRPAASSWLVSIEPELENFRAALQWSLIDRNDVVVGATLVALQSQVLELLARWTESASWCKAALEAIARAGAQELEGWLHFALCRCFVFASQDERAAAAGQRAVELFRAAAENGDRPDMQVAAARVLAFVAWALSCVQRCDEADRAAEEAVRILRDQPRRSATAWALIVRSNTVDPGDFATRRAFLDEAWELDGATPGMLTGGLIHIGRCAVELDAGQFELARTSARDAAEQLRRSGVGSNLAGWALALAASAAVAGGKPEDAFRDAREALSEARCGPAMLFGAQLAAAEAALRDDRSNDAARIVGAVQGARSRGCLEPPAMFRFHNTAMQRLLERLHGCLPDGALDPQLAVGRKRTFEEAVSASLACLPAANTAQTR